MKDYPPPTRFYAEGCTVHAVLPDGSTDWAVKCASNQAARIKAKRLNAILATKSQYYPELSEMLIIPGLLAKMRK